MANPLLPTKEQWEERQRQWAAFNEWEESQPLQDLTPGQIVEALGAILEWLPMEVRLADPDPEKLGIAEMQRGIAVLAKRHERA